MGSDLLDSARSIEPRIVSTRRTIHSHPEMGYQEEQTSTLVQARLRDDGAEVTPMSVDQFAGFVKSESDKYIRIVKETGVKPE